MGWSSKYGWYGGGCFWVQQIRPWSSGIPWDRLIFQEKQVTPTPDWVTSLPKRIKNTVLFGGGLSFYLYPLWKPKLHSYFGGSLSTTQRMKRVSRIQGTERPNDEECYVSSFVQKQVKGVTVGVTLDTVSLYTISVLQGLRFDPKEVGEGPLAGHPWGCCWVIFAIHLPQSWIRCRVSSAKQRNWQLGWQMMAAVAAFWCWLVMNRWAPNSKSILFIGPHHLVQRGLRWCIWVLRWISWVVGRWFQGGNWETSLGLAWIAQIEPICAEFYKYSSVHCFTMFELTWVEQRAFTGHHFDVSRGFEPFRDI